MGLQRSLQTPRAPNSAAERSWRAPSWPTGFGGGRRGIPSSAAIRKVLKSEDPRQRLILSSSIRNSPRRACLLMAQGHQPCMAETRRVLSSSPPLQNSSPGLGAREVALAGLPVPDRNACGLPGLQRKGSNPTVKGARAEPPTPARTLGTFSSKSARFSPKDARHSPCAPGTPLSLHVYPPNSSRGNPQAQTAPRNSQGTLQPASPLPLEPSFAAFCPPRTVLLAFLGSQKQTKRKCLLEEPPVTRPVTETKA
jgi:hypothetical protein